jgi:hypothetical protein
METSTEGKDELERLRKLLTWVNDGHKTMGFGEKFPVDNVTKNDFRSQSNRRVEIMMFDEGEEPDLDAAATSPEGIETYLPGVYGKVAVESEMFKNLIAIRFCNAEGTAIPGAIYSFALGNHKWKGNADRDGWGYVHVPKGQRSLVAFWKSPVDSNQTMFEGEIVYEFDATADEQINARLSNLGYYGQVRESQLNEYRVEFGRPDALTSEQLIAEIFTWHDGADPQIKPFASKQESEEETLA